MPLVDAIVNKEPNVLAPAAIIEVKPTPKSDKITPIIITGKSQVIVPTYTMLTSH